MTKFNFLLLTFFCFTMVSQAQIQNSNAKPDEKKVKKKERKNTNSNSVQNDSIDKTTIYLNAGYVNAFRSFGDSTLSKLFKEWESQSPIHSFSFEGGAQVPLSNNLNLSVGVSFANFGEQNTLSDSLSDSTFSYVRKYRQLGIPIRLNYSFGSNPLKPFVFAGVIPSSVFQIRYESNYRTAQGMLVTNDVITTTNNLAGFNLAVSGGAGVTYDYNMIGFSLLGEYRRNLLNTYTNLKMTHKLYGVFVTAGFHFKI